MFKNRLQYDTLKNQTKRKFQKHYHHSIVKSALNRVCKAKQTNQTLRAHSMFTIIRNPQNIFLFLFNRQL